MRLLSLKISNFGKLSDYSLDFEKQEVLSQDLHEIVAENGWGKSTLAAFIRVMFFGFENENKRSSLERERNQYAPWQKGTYGGEIRFEVNGKKYQLNRVFGSKEAEDSFQLFFADTMLISNDFTTNIGEEIFQIDSASFARTVFIGQNDCITSTTDRINAKLGNLSDHTDDLNNFETAKQTLVNLLNSMSPKRKTGAIEKKKNEAQRLQIVLRNSELLEEQIGELRQKRNEILKEREVLLTERKELQGKQGEIQKQLTKYLEVQDVKTRYELLEQQYKRSQYERDEARRELPAEIPAMQLVKELQSQWIEAERKADSLEPLEDVEIQKWKHLQNRFAKGLPTQESLDQLQSDIAKLGAYRISIQNMEQEKKARRIEEQRRIAQEKRLVEENQRQQRQFEKQQQIMREQEKQKQRKNSLLMRIMGCVLIGLAVLLLAFMWKVNQIVAIGVGLLLVIMGIVFLAIGQRFVREAYDEEIHDKETYDKETYDEETYDEEAGYSNDCDVEKEEFYEDPLYEEPLYEEAFHEESFSEDNRGGRKQPESSLVVEYGKLEHRIQKFFAHYSGEDHLIPEAFEQLYNQVEKQVMQYMQLQKKHKLFIEKKKEIEKAKQDIKDALLRLGIVPIESEIMAMDTKQNVKLQLEMLEENLRNYRAKEQEYQRVDTQWNDFLQTVNVEELKSLEKPKEDVAELLTKRQKEIEDALEEIVHILSGINRQMEELQSKMDERAQDLEEYEALKLQIEEDLEKYKLLEKTKNYLEQAKQSFTAKYMTPILRGFRKYYEIMAKQGGDEFLLDANTKLSVMEQNQAREISSLSVGKQDLVGLCMRMALVEGMYQEEKPFLILDDTFVNMDEDHLAGAIDFLREVSKEYQVIYFTCHESRSMGTFLLS